MESVRQMVRIPALFIPHVLFSFCPWNFARRRRLDVHEKYVASVVGRDCPGAVRNFAVGACAKRLAPARERPAYIAFGGVDVRHQLHDQARGLRLLRHVGHHASRSGFQHEPRNVFRRQRDDQQGAGYVRHRDSGRRRHALRRRRRPALPRRQCARHSTARASTSS